MSRRPGGPEISDDPVAVGPIATLSVAYADTSAARLGFSLDAPLQDPLAVRDAEIDGITVSVRLLGTSHQVVLDDGVHRICETVACLPEVASAVPESFQQTGYHFTSRVEQATPDRFAPLVEQLTALVTERSAAGFPCVLGVFPGHPHAVTAIVTDASPEEISWRTWHAYPNAGEVVVTASHLTRDRVADS
ncbi:DUF2617 family protein [Gordonia paraffinivorans]|uniref:DUF2617 family protein n=1 Tax=Gordonia paraffinivorans TaxID=175628 RepID=UPI001B357291|nr:DUF2617 family protein [Gordonia paraffinivorans]